MWLNHATSQDTTYKANLAILFMYGSNTNISISIVGPFCFSTLHSLLPGLNVLTQRHPAVVSNLYSPIFLIMALRLLGLLSA